eukprot:154717-Amphidinium_carterae.1
MSWFQEVVRLQLYNQQLGTAWSSGAAHVDLERCNVSNLVTIETPMMLCRCIAVAHFLSQLVPSGKCIIWSRPHKDEIAGRQPMLQLSCVTDSHGTC